MKIRLYNVSDASVVQNGRSAYANAGNSPDRPNQFDVWVSAVVTIASSKSFRIDYYTTGASSSTSNLGFPTSISGVDEIYTEVKIWKAS